MSDSDSEGEEYVYYGTPIVAEKSASYYALPEGKAAASRTKALPVSQQQVRDDQGRQRLHGAFTGGFSAGHYNTVGSVVRIHFHQYQYVICAPAATSCCRSKIALLRTLRHVENV